MAGAILVALGCVLLLIAAHPFVTYPLSLALIKRGRPAAGGNASRDGWPEATFSVLLCAYNEAAGLRATLKNLVALRGTVPELQILVYVDGATDGSADIARSFGTAIDLVVSSERRGKTHGINTLTPLARGTILVFTDATVRIAADALERLSHHFANPAIGCVCGHLRYTSSVETATAATGSLYWRLEERTKQLESETGSAMGADGSLYAIRRSCFRAIPPDMIDDMYLSLDVLCQGYRIIRAPDVLAFEAAIPAARDEFRRKIRMSCQGFAAHRALWPRIARLDALTRYKYLSHKVLRWCTAFTMSASALSIMLGAGMLAGGLPTIMAVAATTAILALLILIGWKPAMMLREVMLSFLATAIGVVKAMRGTVIRTWEPASSIRRQSP